MNVKTSERVADTALHSVSAPRRKHDVPAPQKARETQPPGLYLKELQSDIKRNPAGEAFLSVPDKTLLLAIEHINKVISGIDVELHHEIHEASNSIIVTLIDKDTRT